MWFLVVMLLVLAAGCLVVARRPQKPIARRARGNTFAVEFKMYVSPADMDRFDTALDRRTRARRLSAAASLGVAAAAVALIAGVRENGDDLFGPAFYLGIIFTAWIGGLLGELAPRVRAQSGARAARLRSPGADDFLHPALRGYLALLAVTGLMLALVPGARPAVPEELSTTALLFPAVVFLGCELFARLVVALPQPAVDPGELYLADSLRADALSTCYRTGVTFAGLIFVLTATGVEYDQPSWLIGLLATAVSLPTVGVLAWIETRPTRAQLRFRHRLWPELPADAVVSTASGAPVA